MPGGHEAPPAVTTPEGAPAMASACAWTIFDPPGPMGAISSGMLCDIIMRAMESLGAAMA
jgi:hypothetical protein